MDRFLHNALLGILLAAVGMAALAMTALWLLYAVPAALFTVARRGSPKLSGPTKAKGHQFSFKEV